MLVWQLFFCSIAMQNIQQGFIQAILMYGRGLKNSILKTHRVFKFSLQKKIFLKHIDVELAFINLLGFFNFKLFVCPPDVKRPRFLRGFTPWTPTSSAPCIHCRAYNTQDFFTTFENQPLFETGHLKNCLNKCLFKYLMRVQSCLLFHWKILFPFGDVQF